MSSSKIIICFKDCFLRNHDFSPTTKTHQHKVMPIAHIMVLQRRRPWKWFLAELHIHNNIIFIYGILHLFQYILKYTVSISVTLSLHIRARQFQCTLLTRLSIIQIFCNDNQFFYILPFAGKPNMRHN